MCRARERSRGLSKCHQFDVCVCIILTAEGTVVVVTVSWKGEPPRTSFDLEGRKSFELTIFGQKLWVHATAAEQPQSFQPSPRQQFAIHPVNLLHHQRTKDAIYEIHDEKNPGIQFYIV